MDVKTLGKVLGGIGVVLLVSAPFTWYVLRAAPYAATYAGLKIALGIIMVAYWVFRGRDAGDERAFFFYVSSGLIGVAVVVLGAGVNFIANKRMKTYDWTTKKIYSLAPQTLQTLKDLKEPVKAYGFMDSKHQAYDVLKNLFDRYASESDNFTYDFKDPKKSIELNAKYNIKEGQTTVIITKGKGATESHTALSIISEQELTNALVKLGSSGTQKVYFLAGHGEWPLVGSQAAPGLDPAPALSELKESLGQEGYAVEALDLAQAGNEIPKDAAVLVIAHASSQYTKGESATIEKYLGQGGRLIYFADWDAESGLEPLLAKYGVQVEQGVVADALNMNDPFSAVGFPSEHEIGAVLKQLNANLLFQTARGLTPLREGTAPGVMATPVMTSSPKSWVETTPENPDPSDGERLGAIPLIVA
ncbi:MAG: GldG family protein, partial [Myxococcaceae bacterium]|nr:GldG family protein [Myxococcaceae bacterium]